MKTKEIEIDGKKITIWKMNMGFQSDYQDDTTSNVWKTQGKKKIREVVIHNGKTILMTLVFGIFESKDLEIPAPKDVGLGLTPEEKEHRIRQIRSWDFNTDKLFEEINNINTDVDEEVLKK